MDRAVVTVGPTMNLPIMYDSDRYNLVRDIGAGNFGIARLMRDKQTKELVVVKYTERGEKIDENVQREIINHRSLRHPNIIRFKEARFFFRQLISAGVSYCHSMSSVLPSQPKSTVGTPAYIAPEVLLKKVYGGKVNLTVHTIPSSNNNNNNNKQKGKERKRKEERRMSTTTKLNFRHLLP